MVAGVSSGLADYFQLDVTWVRIAFVLAAFFGGGGLWIYIILWIAIPENTISIFNYNTDYKVEDEYQARFTKTKSPINANLIGGLILIVLGSYFLMDEFNVIPEWFSLGKLWPLIFVALGLTILYKGTVQETKSKDFDTSDFKKSEKPSETEDNNNQTL